MSLLRRLAHLQEQIGDDLLLALTDPGNTGKVREFCQGIVTGRAIPATMTVGSRTYELLSFLRGDEKLVVGHTMVARAAEMNANLGEDEGHFVFEHQGDIPKEFRGRVAFVFPSWRDPGNSESVAYIYWSGGRWVQYWHWLAYHWDGSDRLLRRK